MDASHQEFETLAIEGGGRDKAAALAGAIKAGDGGVARDLAALWIHAAARAPGRLAEIYDGSALGWLGKAPEVPAIDGDATRVAIPARFWAEFWALVSNNAIGDAGAVTQKTAALSGQLDGKFKHAAADAALTYPGVVESAAQGYPERFTMRALARAPAGSLGAQFHHLIDSNGFDLEVLDRDALGLSDLPAPLGYLNARILQCHDLWHITAGYETTGLHEVAISGFQAGQFGHHYSSMFLGIVLTKIAFAEGESVGLMLDTILSAWTHGRESPPLLGVGWPGIWNQPVDQVRARLNLAPYASPYPADLFEQMRAQ